MVNLTGKGQHNLNHEGKTLPYDPKARWFLIVVKPFSEEHEGLGRAPLDICDTEPHDEASHASENQEQVPIMEVLVARMEESHPPGPLRTAEEGKHMPHFVAAMSYVIRPLFS